MDSYVGVCLTSGLGCAGSRILLGRSCTFPKSTFAFEMLIPSACLIAAHLGIPMHQLSSVLLSTTVNSLNHSPGFTALVSPCEMPFYSSPSISLYLEDIPSPLAVLSIPKHSGDQLLLEPLLQLHQRLAAVRDRVLLRAVHLCITVMPVSLSCRSVSSAKQNICAQRKSSCESEPGEWGREQLTSSPRTQR